ncbi:MAG TPA: hypothetical protein VKM55_12355 [Candidatus Lokiarchaeia archaeon]|nr:hypothetical protein [Candidatus Lokiarchaeia archaeon]
MKSSIPGHARRIDALNSILNRAIDPEALKQIMAAFGFEQTIFNTQAAATAQFSFFRIQIINEIPYILCPVPFLFDDKRNIEAGFAIDVDQDHFFVYAYLHNYTTKESLVLSKLPHCVHRAIGLDAIDYESVRDEVKEMTNEASAMFFINSLLADLTVEGEMPVEVFDDKLYLQLLNRIVRITDSRWVNHAVIGKKFDQLMHQLENLDFDDSFFENNKLRVFTNVSQFLFGVSDIMDGNCFASYLDPSIVERHANTIQAFLGSMEFLKFLFEFQGFSQDLVQLLIELFILGKIQLSRPFIRAIFDNIGMRISKDEKTNVIMKLMASTKIMPDDDVIQGLYQELFTRGDIAAMKRLHIITGIEPTGAWLDVKHASLHAILRRINWPIVAMIIIVVALVIIGLFIAGSINYNIFKWSWGAGGGD